MQEHIAIIGSGMAGLAAAWICQRAGHTVTVFESQTSRGMDAHTLDMPGPHESGWVDVPLRVMSPHAWGSVLALSAEVGIETFEVDTFVSCSWMDQSTWLRTGRLKIGGWDLVSIGAWKYFNLDAARLVRGLLKLSRATRQLAGAPHTDQTLEEFFRRGGYEPIFWRGLVLPLLSTICTCREEFLLRWPARELLPLLHKILHGRPLLRLKGGTRALVSRLASGLHFYSGSPVKELTLTDQGVSIVNGRGEGGLFDRAIIATQANHTQFLDARSFARERSVLQRFTFDQGELVVHSDTRFMPQKRADWTALNYLMSQDFRQSMFTVWVNSVEPSIRRSAPVFQTWNPLFEPDPAHTLVRVPLQRAVVTAATEQGLQDLTRLHSEPGRRVFFCGSWAHAGVPLLESAVRSALEVARHLGISVPWDRKTSSFLPFVTRLAPA